MDDGASSCSVAHGNSCLLPVSLVSTTDNYEPEEWLGLNYLCLDVPLDIKTESYN